MKIRNKQGVWIDTKTDWGYKTNAEFVLALLEQTEMMGDVLSEILNLNTLPDDLNKKIKRTLDRNDF